MNAFFTLAAMSSDAVFAIGFLVIVAALVIFFSLPYIVANGLGIDISGTTPKFRVALPKDQGDE